MSFGKLFLAMISLKCHQVLKQSFSVFKNTSPMTFQHFHEVIKFRCALEICQISIACNSVRLSREICCCKRKCQGNDGARSDVKSYRVRYQ